MRPGKRGSAKRPPKAIHACSTILRYHGNAAGEAASAVPGGPASVDCCWDSRPHKRHDGSPDAHRDRCHASLLHRLRDRHAGVSRSILVPIDGSRHAAAALNEAITIATRDGARLTLIHVLTAPHSVFVTGPYMPPPATGF